ncbi:hypothetical protein JCM15519_36560 [Fundidesulfovibrio butyratiphilus]
MTLWGIPARATGGVDRASAWMDTPAGKRLVDVVCAVMCVVVLAVAGRMCLVSAFNVHPDEKDHVNAGKYYMHYWDPPRVGDERTMGAYSNYGISYLHQLDAVYFFAGKFARVIQPAVGEAYLALRLFNLSLLAVLLLLFYRLDQGYRLAFLPLFISPQIWYIFSYFNGDALPLFLSFLAVRLLIACFQTADNPLAEASGPGGGRLWAALGVTLGLIAISKQNYYVYLGFFLCMLGLLAHEGKRSSGFNWRRFVVVVLLAGSIFALRLSAHVLVEVNQPPDAVAKLAEKLAAEDFKPSKQVTGEAYWGLNMRGRGVSATEMFTKCWAWHIFTFRTAFGVYDYMKIPAPFIFYRYVGWLFWGFVGVLGLGLVFFGGKKARIMALMLAAFGAATVFQSFWHSWTADFQAQGRYLFPILAMLGCALAVCRQELVRVRPVLWLLGVGLWGMSVWSFVFVGLAQIQR